MQPLPPWPKTCPCGEVWARTEWAELPPVGRYCAGSDGWIEVRSCFCGRSLVAPLSDLADAAEDRTVGTAAGQP